MATEGNNREARAEPEEQAAGAWRKFAAEHVRPGRIRVLQEEHHDKALVCRLVGVGTAGSDVAAKRCDREAATTERLIYERVLPHLTISALRYYGAVVDDDRQYYWLFLEDAGDEPYRLELQEHRILAGHWLGTMQGSAQRVPSIDGLATRAGSFYLDLLTATHDSTLAVLDHPVLAGCDPAPLETIVRHLNIMQLQWRQVERFCERMPRTLVHGDLGSQNVRIRVGHASNSLLIMDWEKAGWGVPAVDLAQSVGTSVSPDIAAYRSAIRPYWPHLEMTDVLRLAEYGTLFRLINAIAWVNQGFFTWVKAHTTWDSPEWYVSEVRCYEPALANWIAAHALDR